MNTVAQNAAVMEQRASQLKTLLDQLAWPEAQGPYFIRADTPHVLHGHKYTISVQYKTAMFALADASRFKFVDLPKEADDVDVVAWLATQFLDWVSA